MAADSVVEVTVAEEVPYLRLTTQEKDSPPHRDCANRLPIPHTRVDFVHACPKRRGEADWVEFTDGGHHTGRSYGNCCNIVIPEKVWRRWVKATNELTRAVLQVRQSEGEPVTCRGDDE